MFFAVVVVLLSPLVAPHARELTRADHRIHASVPGAVRPIGDCIQKMLNPRLSCDYPHLAVEDFLQVSCSDLWFVTWFLSPQSLVRCRRLQPRNHLPLILTSGLLYRLDYSMMLIRLPTDHATPGRENYYSCTRHL